MSATVDVGPLARLFKSLGEETRLQIVAILSHGELCVCHLEEALRLAQPSVSRHLGTLRAAGVVESRRQGSWVYYRLARQADRSEQHTSELQSPDHLVCRLLLHKKTHPDTPPT